VTCGPCPSSYLGDGASGCTFVDPCLNGNNGGCDPALTCKPSRQDGSVECTGDCTAGYVRVGISCQDVNECATNHGGCDPLQDCLNTIGSFECGPCPEYYVNKPPCTYENQCGGNNGGCNSRSDCVDTGKGRICTDCHDGYEGDGYGDCPDKNECLINNGGCDKNSVCQNTDGSRTCGPCPTGFAGNGESGCKETETRVDINVNYDHLHRTVTLKCPFVGQIIKVVTTATYGCRDQPMESDTDFMMAAEQAAGHTEYTFDAPPVGQITCVDKSNGRLLISYLCVNGQQTSQPTIAYEKIHDSIVASVTSPLTASTSSTAIITLAGLVTFAGLSFVTYKCINSKRDNYESIPQQ